MTNRTEKYREIAFLSSKNSRIKDKEKAYLNALGARAATGEPSMDMRRALWECAVLDHLSLPLNELELLVGRFDQNYQESEEAAALVAEQTDLSALVPANNTIHRVIDYEKLIYVGTGGLIADIDQRIAALSAGEIDAELQTEYMSVEDMLAFYRAGKSSLLAFERFAKRWEATLRARAEITEDDTRRAELLRMADNFVRAPHRPCEHFYEALQCMWLAQFAVKALEDSSLTGRIDAYLYPLYKKDLEDGLITREFAFELIEQLYYKHNEIHGSWPASVMVGGVDWDGNPVMNDLTYMCVEAIQTTKLVNPSVSVCVTDDTPDDLLALCVECIAQGYTRPAFFNDRVIQEGLRAAGVSERDARCYVHSTCVEITPIAASHIMVATPYVNLLRSLEYILNKETTAVKYESLKGVGPGYGGNTPEVYMAHEVAVQLSELDTFQKFFELTCRVLCEIFESHLQADIQFQHNRDHHAAAPFISMLTNDCLARGNDVGRGGARYGFYYPCLIGFSNLVDSLVAVKQAVYEEKIVTLPELARQCRDNFPDKRLQAYLQNKVPKFGNGNDEVDTLAKELYDFIFEQFGCYRTERGERFFPSYFSYIFHGLMGQQTGATPDGREAFTALSEHLGAVRGMDANGPLGVVDSIAKLDHRVSIGGVATNFRFTESFMKSEEGRCAVRDFVRYFMAKDCFEMQFNVVSQKDLKDAQQHPENYRTLMVRVAGYSDYFVNLNPVIQNEIIARTEHGGI